LSGALASRGISILQTPSMQNAHAASGGEPGGIVPEASQMNRNGQIFGIMG
jgi:hypothetical protein